MRLIGWLLTACIALAVLRLAIMVLLIAFCVSAVIALITRPREMVGLVMFFGLSAIIAAQPLAFIAIVSVLCIVAHLRRRLDRHA